MSHYAINLHIIDDNSVHDGCL